MKNILYFLILTLFFSCAKKIDNSITRISGEIKSPIPNTNIIIRSNQIDLNYGKSDYEKIIKVSENGKFSDTLAISKGEYELFYNGYSSSIYLERFYDLVLTFNSNDPTESINYSGLGRELNQFNADKQRIIQNANVKYINNDIKNIDSFIKVDLLKRHSDLLKNYRGEISDSILDKKENDFNDFFTNSEYTKLYLKKLKSEKSKIALVGQKANEFNYLDSNGTMVSLSDFNGKYILIDIWATWCGPCKFEIPYLKNIQNQFKGQNIAFVSISIDDSRDKIKWLNYLDSESLDGIQLFENNQGKSQFINSLNINSIPRFLIINPNGEFENLDAPKPSSEKQLNNLLKSLLYKKR